VLLPQLDLTPQQAKSFLVFGDGIHHSINSDFNPINSCGKKIMTYDFTILQTLIFIVTPYFLMLALTSKDEDDDNDMSGGMMIPSNNTI